jgi:DMSO/TMAO reductase YedYZ molybdopterin-dependent catalytic subunit
MKKFIPFLFILTATLVLIACQAAQPIPSATPGTPLSSLTAAPPATSGPTVLTVVGKETKTFTLEDLKKLPAVEGQAGIKSSTGKITLPALFKGVLLTDLVQQVGGADSTMGLQVEASDGYAMTFSYDQLANGDFITYDPGTGAYNRALVDQGYTIEIVGKDGYSVTLDSARIKDNKDILLAYLVNDNPLSDKEFPLKLVGVGLEKKENVGGVEKIILHLGAEPAESPATATPAPSATAAPTQASTANPNAALTVTGLVEKELSWSLEELKEFEVVKLTVEHPKKGKQDVEGIYLNSLLDMAALKPKAKTLVVISVDGYTVEIELKAIRECKDCLITFNDTGGLNLAMPGMQSSFWARDVATFEVK